jgi:NhaP-type Na+/H+ or K+/H+ antiporter
MIVVFSIIVQGLTIGKLVRRSQQSEKNTEGMNIKHRTSNIEC